jgi:hypothetical protein
MKVALTVECQGVVTPGDLERVAAAIQVQVSRDFGPIWGIDATVIAFERLEQVPLGYWPVILTSRELDEDNRFQITPGAGAFSVVGVLPGWPITASHIVLELLADPGGSRTVPAADPSGNGARIECLVEVAAPCQSPACSYLVNDVMLSDFVTPRFYAPFQAGPAGEQIAYSFAGNVAGPYSPAPSGSLTFVDRPDRRIVYVTREATGRQRSHVFYLKEALKDPLRPAIAALISQRKKAMREKLLSSMRCTDYTSPAENEAMQQRRANALRAELAALAGIPPDRTRKPLDSNTEDDRDGVATGSPIRRIESIPFRDRSTAESTSASDVSSEKIAFGFGDSVSSVSSNRRAPVVRDADVFSRFDPKNVRTGAVFAVNENSDTHSSSAEIFLPPSREKE